MIAVTNSWFDTNVRGLWEKHLLPRKDQLHEKGPMRYLELGVGDGQSMLWVLENLLTDSADRAVGVDPYKPKRRWLVKEIAAIREAALTNLGPAIEAGKAALLEKHSFDAMIKLCAELQGHYDRELFGLIYVDGDHAAWSCLEDMTLGWRLLRPGGVMVVDDTHRVWLHARPLVRFAVEAFERCYETQYEPLYSYSRQRAYVKL